MQPLDEPSRLETPAADSSPAEQIPVAVHELETVPLRRRGILHFWRQIGGGSLTLSLLLHGGLVLIAGIIVFTSTTTSRNIDFLPGGGTQQGEKASSDLAQQVKQKKRSVLNRTVPMQRVVSASLNSSISLPDTPPDLITIPDISSTLGGGKMGSGGFGKGGAGGGFGNGIGAGGLGGVTFKPLMMFGRELKNARKIAVVMDVSRSMTSFLPVVAKELDRIAYGSPLVLYFGCGLKTPPRKLDDKVYRVSDPKFDRFWYWWEGKANMGELRKDYDKRVYPEGEAMPLLAIYQQMKKRPNTYFIDFNGITYTSPALLCKEVMEADTLYWFSDFQDAVDLEHVQAVMKKLRGRKQKLYIHASVRGRSFEVVRDELVHPLGGEVIETKAK